MDNYRKRSQGSARASIDGIMHNPVRTRRRPLKAAARMVASPIPVPEKPLPPIDLALPGEVATSKRYQKTEKKRGLKWWAKRASLALVLLILVTSGLLFGKGFMKVHKVFKGGGTAVALQAHVDQNLLKC